MSATNATVPCQADLTASPTGSCSVDDHQTIQDRVDATNQNRAGECDASLDCATLLDYINRNQHHADARSQLNDVCFGGGNDGHKEALTNALTATAKCSEIYNAKCRPTPALPPTPKAVPIEDPDFMANKSAESGLTGSALTMHTLI